MEEEVKALHKTRASKRKCHFIYKTTCLVTGRWYIGMHSTHDMDDGYLGSGTLLWKSINKHGKENHVREVLEYCEDRKSLATREKEIVNAEMLKEERCLNLMVGGEGGWDKYNTVDGVNQRRHTFKIRSKAGAIGKVKAHRVKWGTDEEYRKQYSAKCSNWAKGNKSFTGRVHSEETKQKISVSMKGKQSGEKNSNYGKRNKCVSKDGVTKRIPLDEVENYLADGWKLGIKVTP